MKTTAFVTIALLIGASGMAAAQCAGWGHKTETTAQNYTPLPDQEPAEVAESPLLLITPQANEEKAES